MNLDLTFDALEDCMARSLLGPVLGTQCLRSLDRSMGPASVLLNRCVGEVPSLAARLANDLPSGGAVTS